jgi:hypothetical protein
MCQSGLILFLLGPSGSGKTYLAECLSHEHNWLHLEADCLRADGMVRLDLKKEWDRYFFDLDPKPLIDVLCKRVRDASKEHVVMSFAGNLITHMTPDRVGVLSWPIIPVFLTGDPCFCKAAFLRREVKAERNLDEQHWHRNNDGLFKYLHNSHLGPYVLQAFRPDGSFRPSTEVYNEIMTRDS